MKPKYNLLLLMIIVILLAAALAVGSAIAVVDLLYFQATPGTNSIMLTWETATEFDNIGFYVRRGLAISEPFTRISPLILSYGDPLSGHIYNYEDADVVIGVQYFYTLEILNADNTSEFTAPVAAIILAPTATSTVTPTRTPTPVITPTTTMTPTPTGSATATRTSTSILPTYTLTLTPSPTDTYTPTPTTTLEPVSVSGLVFPAFSPTASIITDTTTSVSSITATSIVLSPEIPAPESQNRLLILFLIILWIILTLFLFLGILSIRRDGIHRK